MFFYEQQRHVRSIRRIQWSVGSEWYGMKCLHAYMLVFLSPFSCCFDWVSDGFSFFEKLKPKTSKMWNFRRQQGQPFFPNPSKVSIVEERSFEVPSYMAGLIIGKQGRTIQKMEVFNSFYFDPREENQRCI